MRMCTFYDKTILIGYVFFVTTRHITHFCRSHFVMTKVGPTFVATNLSSGQNYVTTKNVFWRNKHVFVATKITLGAPPANDTKVRVRGLGTTTHSLRSNVVSWQ